MSSAQNGQTATDGLYQGPTALSQDAVNVVRRIKLLGFNGIRLPYSMADLINATSRDFHYTACQNIAQADIIRSVTNPNISVPAGALHLHPRWLGHQGCLQTIIWGWV